MTSTPIGVLLVSKNCNFWYMADAKAFQKKVGAKIKKIRISKQIKQIDLAYDLDINKQALNNIEAGRKNITLSTILKLSHALNVHPYELLEI